LFGALYAVKGGLKAVAISDCFNGIGLLIAGLSIPIAAIAMLPNGLSDLFENPENLQVVTRSCPVYDEDTMIRANDYPKVPWGVIPTGLTLKNIEYWTMNQIIVQRALASESLAQGQKGVLFAACMKVMGFAFLCLPGILAVVFQRLGVQDVIGAIAWEGGTKADLIYPAMVNFVLPGWSKGLFMGVMLGSVLSSFNSALNSASTMFTLEIYKVYIDKEASQESLVKVGSFFGIFLTVCSLFEAPVFELSDSIFDMLQLVGTWYAVPVIAVFFVGIMTTIPDALAAKSGFVVGFVCVIGMQVFNPGDDNPLYLGEGVDPPPYATIHFLHIMALSFLLALETIAVMTYSPMLRRLLGGNGTDGTPKPYVQQTKNMVDMTPFTWLPLTILGNIITLTTLLAVLQLSSVVGFIVFWILWIVVCTLLILAPVPDAAPVDGKEAGPQGAGSFLLSLRTNTFSKSSIVAAQI